MACEAMWSSRCVVAAVLRRTFVRQLAQVLHHFRGQPTKAGCLRTMVWVTDFTVNDQLTESRDNNINYCDVPMDQRLCVRLRYPAYIFLDRDESLQITIMGNDLAPRMLDLDALKGRPLVRIAHINFSCKRGYSLDAIVKEHECREGFPLTFIDETALEKDPHCIALMRCVRLFSGYDVAMDTPRTAGCLAIRTCRCEMSCDSSRWPRSRLQSSLAALTILVRHLSDFRESSAI